MERQNDVREAMILAYMKTIDVLPASDDAIIAAFERELEARGYVVESKELRDAAAALIADVRRRYPGEDLRCPFMRRLDAAIAARPRVGGDNGR